MSFSLVLGALAAVLALAGFMLVVSRAFRESNGQGMLALLAPGYTLHYCLTRQLDYRREIVIATYGGGALAIGLHLLAASAGR